MSRHRLHPVRPRYARIAAAGASAAVTMVAVFGGLGLLSFSPEPAGAPIAVAAEDRSVVREAPEANGADRTDRTVEDARHSNAPPSRSGSGRRVVFSEGRQRVWLVDAGGDVRRTYPVSGSATDNLQPGTYQVYSRSEWATGIDDSGTMRWFVRFTQGENAAIGFHSIPEIDGEPVQTLAQLGTPLSHGCIRQRLVDARALWDFAPIGTTVVVVA